MEEEIIKDYGNLNVPTKWEDITLETFVKIMRMQEEKEDKENVDMVDLMALLTGKNREYINSLPSDFVTTIMAHLMFLNTPLDAQPKDSVEIDGVTYRIKHEEKLTFGEDVDVQTIISADKFNYAGVLAVLCRKPNEPYNGDFVTDMYEDRVAFWNSQPITKVYCLIAFFLALHSVSVKHLQASMMDAEQQISQLLRDIEDSVKNGNASVSFMTSLKIRWKLRKLRKCLSSMS